MFVVPWGVPALGSECRMPAELEQRLAGAPFVLAIGTLEPRKNYPHLVAAFAKLAAEHPHAFLVIAGHDGPAATRSTPRSCDARPTPGRASS